MNISKTLLLAVLVALLAGPPAIQAQEKKLKREELPPAVEKTVAEQSKGATIRGFSTEVEGGKRLYEVELVASGRGKARGERSIETHLCWGRGGFAFIFS